MAERATGLSLDAAARDRCRAGQPDAFAGVVERHQQAVFATALRLVGDREEALAVTSTTFAKAYQAHAGRDRTSGCRWPGRGLPARGASRPLRRRTDAAGQTVTIAGQVTGETYAFGRSVTVTGTIERDLITAAQQVTIDGTVRGDLRVAAQQVVINGRVEGNVTSFAPTVTLAQQGTVGGGVLGAAQDVTLLGGVGRGVAVGAGRLYLGGSVGESVQARVETLVVGPDARIAGRLEYTSATQAAVPTGAVAGGVRYQSEPPREQRRQEERPFAGMFGFFSLVWLAGSLIVGILLVHFAPGFAAGAAARVWEQPFSTLGLGALTLLVVPLAALLVAITLVGLPLAFVAGLSYLLGLYIGWLLLGLALGALLVGLVRRRPAPAGRAVDARWLVVLGLLVLYVLSDLP